LFQAFAQLSKHIASGGGLDTAPAVFDTAEKNAGGGVQQRVEPSTQDKDGRKTWRVWLPPGRFVHVMNTVYDHELTNWMKQHLRTQTALSFHTLCAGDMSNRQAKNLLDYLVARFDNLVHSMRGQHRSQDVEISFAMGGGSSDFYSHMNFYRGILDSALRVCEERTIRVHFFPRTLQCFVHPVMLIYPAQVVGELSFDTWSGVVKNLLSFLSSCHFFNNTSAKLDDAQCCAICALLGELGLAFDSMGRYRSAAHPLLSTSARFHGLLRLFLFRPPSLVDRRLQRLVPLPV